MPSTTMDGLAGTVRRADKAKDKMRQWYFLYEELAHYFYNIRKGFLLNETAGQEPDPDIWDSSPEGHRTRLSQAFVQAMAPLDRYWIGLQPARKELMEDDEVRIWCQMAAYYMHLVIYDSRANFSEALAELADDSATFGTAVMLIDFDRGRKHLIFQVKHLKDIAIEVDASGRITHFYCYWMMSLDDIVGEFGIDALPPDMADEYRRLDGGGDCTSKRFEIVHCICPSDEYARYGKGIGRMAYTSQWIMKQGSHLLDQQGYHEIPYVIVRWYRKTGEALGRCDAMRALPDARLIQSVAAALLEITEKQSNPPMQAPVDVIRGEMELWPGGLNLFDTSGYQYQGDPIRPIEIGANPAMTAEYLKFLDQKLGRIFYAELLNMPEEGMKPDQHIQLEAMKAIILAPIWSRVENETAPPILDRVFNIMTRYRALPPVPEILVGEQLIYKFDNQIADMRDVAKAQQSFEAIAMPLQLQHPEIVQTATENVDWDTAFRELWKMRKVPQNWILPMQAVEAERQQRQQMEQAAQVAELAKAGGPGVKQAIEGAVTARDQGLLPAQ